MHYGKLSCFLGLSAIAILGNGLPALSQGSDSTPRSPLEVRITPPKPSGSGGSCFSKLKDKNTFEKDLRESNSKKPKEKQLTEAQIQEKVRNKPTFTSKRVELYYYRNANNIVSILSKLPLGEGCATTLPLNQLQAGQGVGRGGGNIVSLYGTQKYIEKAQRFITSLDLPLPGINLQMWGVQISGKKPNRLAETTSEVRWRITETQRLLRAAFASVQGISQLTLQSDKVDSNFKSLANQLGYADALDGFGGESSILEVFLVGDSLVETERVKFYQNLYNLILASGTSLTNQLDTSLTNELDTSPTNGKTQIPLPLQPYLDALKNDINRPPFERIFRSRGLEPHCMYPLKYEELKQHKENKDLKCEKWEWKEGFVRDLQGNKVSLVTLTANFERKVLLEFALHYADFISNPDQVDPEELQRTADNLNELLQTASSLLQKDIEDFFIKPTLSMIQDIVANDKKLEFAQVGRNTISTLDGVETKVSTSSTSGFQISQFQNVEQLLSRAETLQGVISNFLPTAALGEASEAAETAATGVPLSRLLGLAVASLEQNSIPLEIETGTSLAFTPGISRSLNAAELNINLTVANPTVTPTAEEKRVPPISRIGKQELHTTVYTQALDFFDLSTFTSQATLDGGRFPIPPIGTIWNAIFGAIPVFGDLFSIARPNQNVLHESLILTNSFITPTPLSLGNLYSPIPSSSDFCQRREDVLFYSQEYLKPGGQASRRDTEIIRNRCY